MLKEIGANREGVRSRRWGHCRRAVVALAVVALSAGAAGVRTAGADAPEWPVAASGLWDDPSNWSTWSVPGAGDDVLFDAMGGPYNVTFSTDPTVTNSLTVTSGPVTFDFGGGTYQASKGVEVQGALTLQNGVLATKTNAGLMVDSGGVLTLSDTAQLALGGALTVGPNSTVSFTLGSLGGAKIIFEDQTSDGFTGVSMLQWADGNTEDISGHIAPLALGRTATFDTNGNEVSFATAIKGYGSVANVGDGILFLAAASTYAGSTSIGAGTVMLGVTNALPTTTDLTVNGGTLDLNGFNQQVNSLFDGYALYGSTITNSNIRVAAILTVKQDSDTTFGGTISGNMGLTMSGGGTLNLYVQNVGQNTYTGPTTVSAGTLLLGTGGGTPNILPTTTDLTVKGSGVLDLSGNDQEINSLSDGGVSTGTITSSGWPANLTIDESNSGRFGGLISGNLALTMAGGGSLLLTHANTYSGGTTINSGTLIVHSDGNLGDAMSAININDGTLEVTTGFRTNRSINLGYGSPTIQVDAGTLTCSSALSGYGGLVKTGPGTLNVPNLPSGVVSVNEGLLQVAPGATSHNLVSVGGLAVSGGSLDLTNNDLYISGGAASLPSLLGMVTTSMVGPKGSTVVIALVSGQDYLALGKSDIGGTTVSEGDLVGVFTYSGDANLDGVITADDYLALDMGLVFGLKGWTHGDFAQSGGAITAEDFAIIDNNYRKQSGSLAAEQIALHTQWFGAAYTGALAEFQGAGAVPEPASLALLSAGALGLLWRKKRN